jgi:hypothetical protein
LRRSRFKVSSFPLPFPFPFPKLRVGVGVGVGIGIGIEWDEFENPAVWKTHGENT